MAPSTSPHIVSQLRQLVYYQLDNNLLKNALFLADRLHAYDQKNAEATYLLALCQHQSGLCKSAFDTARSQANRGTHLGCAYIFAQSCLELGRYADGISVLERSRSLWHNRNHWNQHSESRRQPLPDAAAVLCLMGKLWKAHKHMDQAVECWAAALKLNPLMWDAFLGLCESGAKINVNNVYKLSPELHAMMQHALKAESATNVMHDKSSSSAQTAPQISNGTGQSDPFLSNPKSNGIYHNTVLGEKSNISKVSVNTVGTILDEEELNAASTILEVGESHVTKQGEEPPAAPVRKAKSAQDTPSWQIPPPKMRAPSIKSRIRSKAGYEDATVHPDPPPPAPAG